MVDGKHTARWIERLAPDGWREASEPEVASGVTSDFAVAAATAATPASVDRSRKSAGWPLDGAADGGATDGAASGGVVQLEVKGDGGKAAESKAVPGLAAAAASAAMTASDGGEASGAPRGGSAAELSGTAGRTGGSALIEPAACASAVEVPSSASNELAAAARSAARRAARLALDGGGFARRDASADADRACGRVDGCLAAAIRSGGGVETAPSESPRLPAPAGAAASRSDAPRSSETAGPKPDGSSEIFAAPSPAPPPPTFPSSGDAPRLAAMRVGQVGELTLPSKIGTAAAAATEATGVRSAGGHHAAASHPARGVVARTGSGPS